MYNCQYADGDYYHYYSGIAVIIALTEVLYRCL